MKLTIYATDGSVSTQEHDAPLDLDEWQKCIGGGYIQVLFTDGGQIVVFDEDGQMKNQAVNVSGTEAAVAAGVDLHGTQLVGAVVVADQGLLQ
jgi:hypothetical protein